MYLFRNLDTAAGTVTQNARLAASDGAPGARFGSGAVSLVGTVALAGASGANSTRGFAYLFRNLDTATGPVTESAKLAPSGGTANSEFGFALSFSGRSGLVGAFQDDIGTATDQGSAYLFRNLETASGTITENAKLIANDGATRDEFGYSVALAGNVGLVTSLRDDGNRGSAYLFSNLDTATGTVSESVKLVASTRNVGDFFGAAASISGDIFLVTAGQPDVPGASGRAFSGSVGSVTTMDFGNITRSISGVSFTSRIDWIIGETTDGNRVTLSPGDAANVTATGKAVHIGKNVGSDLNTLQIDGALTANEVYIGSIAGNIGNTLQLENTATFQAIAFRLAHDNLLKIEGNYTAIENLLTYLGTTDLEVWNGSAWMDVNAMNHNALIASTFDAGYTEIFAIPEPSTAALICGGFIALSLRPRRLRKCCYRC